MPFAAVGVRDATDAASVLAGMLGAGPGDATDDGAGDAAQVMLGAGPQLYFPPELNVDYGVPTRLCKETSAGSEVFTSDFSQATVQIDCKAWEGSVKMEWERE